MDAFPEVGAWYLNTESGEMFEVVATDESAGDIEMQYFDGELSEVDADSWASMSLAVIPPPENWSAPFEIEEAEVDESDSQLLPHPGEEDLIH
ncbi:MAG: DUF6763 family protein [Gammaproteobacteria bacterium]